MYRAETTSWTDCVVRAVRRWLPVTGAVICQCVLMCVLGVAMGITVGVGAGAVLAAGKMPLAAAIAGGLCGAVLLGLALVGLVLGMTMRVAFDAIAIEGISLDAAISRSFVRIFNRSEFWRACAVALAIGAIVVAAALAAAMLGALLSVLLGKSGSLPSLVLLAAASSIAGAFAAVLTAVYYFDLSVRRDGGDLSALLDALAPPAAPGVTPAEQQVIDAFCGRKLLLAAGVRSTIAQRLAERVRSRVSYDLQGLGDEELLERLSAS